MFCCPQWLCGCNLHIATPYCVHSVLNITNHNRLDNFQSQEIVKASSEIVQEYYNTSSSISSPLEPWVRGPLLDAPYWHLHPLHRPHSFLPRSSSGSVIALLFWRVLFSTYCFCKGLDLLKTPCRTFWHRKQMISPYTTTIVENLIPNFKSSSVIRKNIQCIGYQ